MIRKMLVLFLLLPLLASCGWKNQCTKRATYDLEKEKISTIGSEMIQTGCFSCRNEPTGLNKYLFGIQTQNDGNYFRPIINNELLYSGRAGDILNIKYREYHKDRFATDASSYIRPAFAQEVQYDLKVSDVIMFKQWTIRVIEADNQMIRFVVLKEPLLDEGCF